MAIISGMQRGAAIDLKNCFVFLKTKALITGDLVWMALRMGSGQLTSSEPASFNYILNRGVLDDVRPGDDAVTQVNISGRFTNYISMAGGAVDETASILEIVKGKHRGNIDDHGTPKYAGTREDWLSQFGCPPYCFDIEVHNNPGVQCPDTDAIGEATLFRYCRVTSNNPDFSGGDLSLTVEAHVTQPISARCAALGKSAPGDEGSGVFAYNKWQQAKPLDYTATFWKVDPRSLEHPYYT